MIYVLLDEFNVITSYSIKLSDNQVFSDEWIVIDTDIELDLLIFNYKYVDGELIELTDEEKQRYLHTPKPTLEDLLKSQESKISSLEIENKKLKIEQEQQNEEILVSMLANTEMFEMVLGMLPMTLLIEDETKDSGCSKGICDIYASLIEKGVKTINDVPTQIVEQVKNNLGL